MFHLPVSKTPITAMDGPTETEKKREKKGVTCRLTVCSRWRESWGKGPCRCRVRRYRSSWSAGSRRFDTSTRSRSTCPVNGTTPDQNRERKRIQNDQTKRKIQNKKIKTLGEKKKKNCSYLNVVKTKKKGRKILKRILSSLKREDKKL